MKASVGTADWFNPSLLSNTVFKYWCCSCLYARNVKKGQFLSCKSYELIMEMQVKVLFTFELQFGLASFYEC